MFFFFFFFFRCHTSLVPLIDIRVKLLIIRHETKFLLFTCFFLSVESRLARRGIPRGEGKRGFARAPLGTRTDCHEYIIDFHADSHSLFCFFILLEKRKKKQKPEMEILRGLELNFFLQYILLFNFCLCLCNNIYRISVRFYDC